MKKLYTLLIITLFLGFSSNAQVVISQVYGGGGNSGAKYTNDFIELFNRGSVAQDLTGWSVQYASTSGTTWAVTNLGSFSLQPGQYCLVQGASEAAVGSALPTPDVIGTLNLSATNGKVLLANVTTAQNVANPTGSQIIDKVGYGSANGYETTAMAVLSNTKSGQRLNTGCTDTNNNSTDFTTATPAPRNSSTAVNTCVLSVKQNEISGLNVYPNPVKNGTLYISSDSASAKSVEIYDILGKQVLNAKTSNNAINVSNLKGGVYIVKITEDGKTDTKKLIIQ